MNRSTAWSSIERLGLRAALIVVLSSLCVAAAVPAQASSPSKANRVLRGHRLQVHAVSPRARGHASRTSLFGVPLRTKNPRALRRAKAAAARRARRSGSYGRGGFGTRTNVPFDSSPLGFSTWSGLAGGNSSPSDSNGSISPTYYVETVNSLVAAYQRSNHALVGTGTDTLDAWVAGIGTCDPRVEWDQQQQRWFYVAVRCDGTTTDNELYLGWSKTSDPTSFGAAGWCRFILSTTTTMFDYPKLGDNLAHFIIGTNNFNSAGAYVGSDILTTAKPPLNDTSCAVPRLDIFGTAGIGFTPNPANMFDDGPDGFVVSAPFSSGSAITTYRVSGGGGAVAPTVTNIGAAPVTAFSVPANAPQPGSANLLNTLDSRLTTAVGGPDPDAGLPAVWTQHTVAGPGGRSQVKWYEITYAGSLPATPAVRQEGFQSSATQFYFNGAISPTTQGNQAVLHYNAAGTTAPQYVQVRAASRLSTDTLGQMVGEKSLFTSNHSSTDFTCPGPRNCRWGDYAGISPDPSDPTAVWGTSMVLKSAPASVDWSTRNFAVSTSSLSVSSSGGVLSVAAAAGQGNKIQIDDNTGPATVSEFSWPTMRVGTGCSLLFSSQASCTLGPANTIDANDGNDTVTGGDTGADTITGGTGADRLFGRGGNDTINANDGAADTTIDCGAGTDVANIDAADSAVTSNCETVNVI